MDGAPHWFCIADFGCRIADLKTDEPFRAKVTIRNPHPDIRNAIVQRSSLYTVFSSRRLKSSGAG
jgi:hypothetical protein